MEEQELRNAICAAGRRLYETGLVGACEGNISVRLGPRRILATPSGFCKGALQPSDLVVIDDLGDLVNESQSASEPSHSQRPSSEIKMHLRIYARRPDCQAVIHAHPLTATGISLAGQTIPDDIMPEAAFVLGPVALVPFGMPGTNEVPDGLEPFLQNHKSFLLANHGAVVMGKTVEDALFRMETLERIAKVYVTAMTLGKVTALPRDAQTMISEKLLHGRLQHDESGGQE